MKNTNIQKIRQLLIEIKQYGCCGYAVDRLNRILALLPCETCGDTGKKIQSGCFGVVHKETPCLDCQPSKKPLDFQEMLDCWLVHPIDDDDCVLCPQMYECRDYRKTLNP